MERLHVACHGVAGGQRKRNGERRMLERNCRRGPSLVIGESNTPLIEVLTYGCGYGEAGRYIEAYTRHLA